MKKTISLVIFGVFALAYFIFLIFLQQPTWEIAQHNYLTDEDVIYGEYTHPNWVYTKNPFSLLGAALSTVFYQFGVAAGNYTSVFLGSFTPNTFDDWGLLNSTGSIALFWIFLILIIASSIIFFVLIQKSNLSVAICFPIVLMLLFTQLIPNYGELFNNWYFGVNGLFLPGLALLYFSLIGLYWVRKEKKEKWLLIIIGILSFLLAGSLFTLSFAIWIIFIGLGLFLFLFYKEKFRHLFGISHHRKKHKHHGNHHNQTIFQTFDPLVWSIAPFFLFSLISLIAPGNYTKFNSAGGLGNLFVAIYQTFVNAFSWIFCGYWATATESNILSDTQQYDINGINFANLGFLVLLPIFIFSLVKLHRFSYPHLLWVSLFSFILLIAAWFPTSFVNSDKYSQLDIDFNFIWFWLVYSFWWFYFSGWIKAQVKIRGIDNVFSNIMDKAGLTLKSIFVPIISGLIILAVFNPTYVDLSATDDSTEAEAETEQAEGEVTLGDEATDTTTEATGSWTFPIINIYDNGSPAFLPTYFSSIQTSTTPVCSFGNNRDFSEFGLSTGCSDGAFEKKTALEWNDLYILTMKRDLLGGPSITDEQIKLCDTDFMGDACQSLYMTASIATLPDSPTAPLVPTEDQQVFANINLCPDMGQGFYNSQAAYYWNKSQIKGYYPDIMLPNDSTVSSQNTFADLDVYIQAKYPSCGLEVPASAETATE